MPFLILLQPDGTTASYEIKKDKFSIGSRKDNDIAIPLKGISRHHAQVVRDGAGWAVEDLNSTNFVFVDGEQVQHKLLADGNSVSLGDYAFLLYLDELDPGRVRTWIETRSRKEPTNSDLMSQTTRIYHKSLPKTVRELEALIEVGAQLTRIADTDQVLNEILVKVLSLMQADRGFIMLLDETGALNPAFSKNMEKDLVDDGTEGKSYSTSFARKSIEAARTLVSTNVAEDPRYQSESIISQRILSIMCAPLKCADKLLGCLYIDVRESVRYFSDEDASFFTALANQAAIAIDNSRLTADLRKNQEFLEKTNVQLQDSLQQVIETNVKLDRKIGEISALFDVSRDLNVATEPEAVLRKVLEQSRLVVKCERASLLMYEKKVNGFVARMITGGKPVAPSPTILRAGEGVAGAAVQARRGLIANLGSRDPRFKLAAQRDEDIRSLMAVPLVSGDRVFGVMNLINAQAPDGFRDDDLQMVASMANLAAASIQKHHLLQAKLAQEKLNQEIEDAQKVQQLLLPRIMPESNDFEFAARYSLANRVGGDYYDFIPLAGGKIAVVIADVSGHDIASALVMAMGRNLIRILFETMSNPSEVLAKTSAVLRKDTQASRYITMFLAVLDPQKMTMTYSNAGHNYPLFLQDGAKDFIHLEAGGFPLGLVDDFNYMEETLALKPGDLLVLYTDGLIEAQAPGGEMFELERLQRAVMSFREDPVEVITGSIYEQVGSFLGTGKLQDDLTFVTMRVKPKKDSYMVSFPCRRDLIPGYGSKVVAFLNSRGFGTQKADQIKKALAALLTSVAPASAHSSGPDRLVHLRVTPAGRSAVLCIRSDGEHDSGPCFVPGSWTPLVDCGASIDRKEAGNEVVVTFQQDGVIQ